MIKTTTFPAIHAAILATTLAMAAPASAQDVLISEIHATGNDRWIELHNRGQWTVDLSSWSLYQATRTSGMPQHYWWGFAPGTTLASGAFLRVHWNRAAAGQVLPGEYYTGASPYGFLFGLGGEHLDGTRGALGLLSSQASNLMNSAAVVEDWVSWGEHGFARESLAEQAGVWNSGHHCPPIPAGTSLARDVAAVGAMASRDLEWFVDPTPTPNGSNVTGSAVFRYGTNCAVTGHHLMGAPTLRVRTQPLLGNSAFGYSIDMTTGVFGESLLFAFSTGPAPVGLPSLLPPVPGPACLEAIDTRHVLATVLMPTTVLLTEIPMSLANLPPAMSGIELHAQALLFDWLPNAWPPFQGLTNAVGVVLGH